MVQSLVLDCRADVNVSDKYGYTALIKAAMYGYKETVELLLQYDANVNSKTISGDTGLILAAKRHWLSHKDVAELLLEYNADVNA